MQNADPRTDRGDYAHNFDESSLISGRIVEESLMGKNAARRFKFQKEINETVDDHVPFQFLPLWKKITIKTQKVIKKHFKKQDLLISIPLFSSGNVTFFQQPKLPPFRPSDPTVQ